MSSSQGSSAAQGTTALRSDAQHSAGSRGPSDLYLSARDQGWKPPGCRIAKDWDVCSMGRESARRYLGSWAVDSAVIEAIAWFDPDDGLRVLVIDLEGGRRVIVRLLATTTKVTFSRWKDRPAQQANTAASAEGTEAAQVAGESSREDH